MHRNEGGVPLKRAIKLIAVVGVLGIVAAACGGNNGGGGASPTTSGSTAADLSGGTLHLAQLSDVSAAFDPQKEYYAVSWEYFQCCLLRTLMSYKGIAGADGSVIYPDLATGNPTVSSDGLTWTWTIKPGIHYAPPLQNVEITSGDFVRAVEREACSKCNVNGYSFYYSIIKGFDDYANGKAKTISGLATPDDHTFQVTLTAPAGDLGYRFAMPATAPIPPWKNEPLGVATGHDADYGRFLVASGPYMWQGSENLDFSKPADQQTPAAGYIPGRSIVLVRNPSWDKSTDDLRDAYPDQIQTEIGGNNNDLYNKVQAGQIDYVVDGIVPPQLLKQYETNPDLQPLLHINPADGVRYISMNVAEPPFDDIHVRKAMNWVLDKAGMRQLRGGPSVGDIAGHDIINTLENNVLKDYNPYATPNDAGDVNKAKAEMKLSKYDTNGDGVCDASVCKNILSVTDNAAPYPDQAALIRQDLAPLGMTLDVKELQRTTMYTKCNDPVSQFALCLGPGWFKDYADAFTFMLPLFDSSSNYPSCCNYSLLGAPASQLSKWGYSVTSVPNVDSEIDNCAKQTGDARPQCAANFDKDLMENVVPWVPYLFDNNVDVISTNVINYSYDQFAGLASFEKMAVKH